MGEIFKELDDAYPWSGVVLDCTIPDLCSLFYFEDMKKIDCTYDL